MTAINPLLGALLSPLARHYGDPATVEVRMNRARLVDWGWR